MRRLLFILLCLATGVLHAHPVAQGSLEFDLRDDHLMVRARVSNEEVFVASAFEQFQPPAGDLDALFRHHGDYLLRHLQLRAQDRLLKGSVEEISIPEDRAVSGYAGYQLRYSLEGAPPAELVVNHDVLQGIEFAPGNNWTATFVVSVRHNGALVREGLLLPQSTPLTIDFAAHAGPALDRSDLFASYLHHGVVHILEGWDHLLFMAALVLAVTSFWELVKVVTAFTVAHTLTLALSTFGLARLPSSFVEPMIALSIVVVAGQNVFYPRSARGGRRLLAAFAFGLFHGLGFAGGLLEAMQEMSTTSTTIALGGFSVGVELGHQAVVLPALGLMALVKRPARGPVFNSPLARYGSVVIALAGCVYFVLALRG